MKKLGVIAIATALAASAFGQGQIFFNNRGTVGAAVYGVNPAAPAVRLSGNSTTNGGTLNYSGIPLVNSSNFTAQLWYGPAGTAMGALVANATPQGTVPFRAPGSFDGFVQQTAAAATLNGIAFDSTAAIQMRVWDNRGGTITSWAAAITAQANDPTLAMGFSDVFTSLPLVGPPNAPPGMTGLQSFNLTVVPEPSVIALGALGLGALLLRRRKS
jgi:hypothetical protein